MIDGTFKLRECSRLCNIGRRTCHFFGCPGFINPIEIFAPKEM